MNKIDSIVNKLSLFGEQSILRFSEKSVIAVDTKRASRTVIISQASLNMKKI